MRYCGRALGASVANSASGEAEREVCRSAASGGAGASPARGAESIASRSSRWQIGQWRVRCRYPDAADRCARSRARVSCLAEAAMRHLHGPAGEAVPEFWSTEGRRPRQDAQRAVRGRLRPAAAEESRRVAGRAAGAPERPGARAWGGSDGPRREPPGPARPGAPVGECGAGNAEGPRSLAGAGLLDDAVLTGFEPAASTLTGWRALQTAPQDQVCGAVTAVRCEKRLYRRVAAGSNS